MEAKLLIHTNDKLSPEARWLLLRWSAVPGLKKPMTSPRLELYRQLGMTHHHARTALEELKKKGILIDEQVRQKQGRPISCLHISSDFQTRLQNLSTVPPYSDQPEIESLLEHSISARISRAGHSRNLMTGDERTNKLTPATYWLLAVLLAHARTPGIVTGLGLGQLMALTGMTRERLRSQLSKLKKLGIMGRNVPGASRDQGTRYIRSVYIFNLSHPILMGQKSLALTAFLVPEGGVSRHNFISGVLKAAAVKAKLIKHQDHVSKKIEYIFSLRDGEYPALKQRLRSKGESPFLRAIADYHQDAQSLLPPLHLSERQAGNLIVLHKLGIETTLHAHLLGYAMTLLSNHWNEISHNQGNSGTSIKPVILAIERRF